MENTVFSTKYVSFAHPKIYFYVCFTYQKFIQMYLNVKYRTNILEENTGHNLYGPGLRNRFFGMKSKVGFIKY